MRVPIVAILCSLVLACGAEDADPVPDAAVSPDATGGSDAPAASRCYETGAMCPTVDTSTEWIQLCFDSQGMPMALPMEDLTCELDGACRSRFGLCPVQQDDRAICVTEADCPVPPEGQCTDCGDGTERCPTVSCRDGACVTEAAFCPGASCATIGVGEPDGEGRTVCGDPMGSLEATCWDGAGYASPMTCTADATGCSIERAEPCQRHCETAGDCEAPVGRTAHCPDGSVAALRSLTCAGGLCVVAYEPCLY